MTENTPNDRPSNGSTPPGPSAGQGSHPAVPQPPLPQHPDNFPHLQGGSTARTGSTAGQGVPGFGAAGQAPQGPAQPGPGQAVPPAAASYDGAFPKAPPSLDLTPQIRQDYAGYAPPKAKPSRRPGSARRGAGLLGGAVAASVLVVGGLFAISDDEGPRQLGEYDGDSRQVQQEQRPARGVDAVEEFGNTIVFKSGLEVTAEEPKVAAARSTTRGALGDSFIVVTVTVKNDSDQTIKSNRLSDLVPQLTYGDNGAKAATVVDSTLKVANQKFRTLYPGESQTLRFGFDVPERGLSRVEMSLQSGSERALFAGSYSRAS